MAEFMRRLLLAESGRWLTVNMQVGTSLADKN